MGKMVTFDEIRRELNRAFNSVVIPEDVPKIYVIRNLYGEVGLAVSQEHEQNHHLRKPLEKLAATVGQHVGAHGKSSPDSVLWVRPELLESLDRTAQKLQDRVFLEDRLLMGGGWRTIDPIMDKPPVRYVLYSVKGGTGRSTTAAVLSWFLAKQGMDVLAVDLDLESPGLASVLLEPATQPEFGVTDWFVEELVGQGDLIVDRIVGSPKWMRDLPGTVWVAPAHGRDAGEYLSKLGRVYMDTVEDPWTARLRRMIESLEIKLQPDVVLVESRSGLHDIAAATVSHLGAEVMLFGVDAPSTWTGYGILLEHWKDRGMARDMRERLAIVSSQTPELDTERYLTRFRERSWDMFRDNLYDTLADSLTAPEEVSYAFEDEEAPHSPLVIHWNRGLAAGSAWRHLTSSVVKQAYQPFLERFKQQHQARIKELAAAAVPRVKNAVINPVELHISTGKPEATVVRRGDGPSVTEIIRLALSELPEGTSHGPAPGIGEPFLPHSHRKALDQNVLVVTGMRGSGKTFWWSALQDPAIRTLLGEMHPRLAPIARAEFLCGFGVTPSPEQYPTNDQLRSMLSNDVEPRIVWRTVHITSLVHEDHPLKNMAEWSERVDYVRRNPSEIERAFHSRDKGLDREDKYSLILFDALDRCAPDWDTVRQLIQGLLQHALEMRSYQRLRVKVFLRSDQADDPEIAAFPDASKVFSSEVQLDWPRSALYGLLWQLLGNGESGKSLRPFLAEEEWPVVGGSGNLHVIPASISSDEEFQRSRFHELISGPWMGSGPKRGFPYTWIPNHLCDAKRRVSPRSFLTAVRAAAKDTAKHYPDHEYALHYNSIKRGVQEASKVRVREVAEDYPWVHMLLDALEGTVVPCPFLDIEGTWNDKDILKQLSEGSISQEESGLPPPGLRQGGAGLRADLESVGVFRHLSDDRVDIPDVFRIGYGLGQRGGIRPVR